MNSVLERLNESRPNLWSRWIPDMVGGYFADLQTILRNIHHPLTSKGKVWMVVGDSRYSGIQIETAKIISELAPDIGYRVEAIEPFRSMRSSAQQGGHPELAESLVKLTKLNSGRSRRLDTALS